MKGFTLIELMIVVAIIGIVSALVTGGLDDNYDSKTQEPPQQDFVIQSGVYCIDGNKGVVNKGRDGYEIEFFDGGIQKITDPNQLEAC